jgi:hypothetical protein
MPSREQLSIRGRGLAAEGGYLEKPQRLGVLPTLSFWKRPDVWTRARWFVAPVMGVTVGVGVFVGSMLPVAALPAVALGLGMLPPYVVAGLLERYIRGRIRQKRHSIAAAENRP